MTGKTLGHYQVTEKLGSGGMGEVYRARDTRLNRDVALKFLPAAFANDRERLARFEREAQLLAQLNHQNIAAIHGFEQDRQECLPYLVLEYVPGETLKGPLPIEEAMQIAAQIMAALEEAHGKGIVHRDLKPANVKITPDGKVKVLDFGLAKALADEGASEVSPHSPTLSALATRMGTILGTAAYMSPEQARGKKLDKRTDVWSFGCVLYELLTGSQSFGGETISDCIMAILGREPDWSKLPPETPRNVQRLLKLCLEKDPSRRLRDIGDAWIGTEEQPAAAPPPRPVAPSPRRLLPWAAAALLAFAAGVFAWLWLRIPTPAPRPIVHLTAPLPPLSQIRSIALSPDGSRLAYSAGAPPRLHVRMMDQLEGKLLPGTENGISPFFSPDGQWLGFLQDNKWKKVQVIGGATITLCDANSGPGRGGADWGIDGTIIFGTVDKGLSKVSAAGGAPQAVTTLDPKRGDRAHRWPQILPGGQAVLFAAGQSDFNNAKIVALSLKTGEQQVLIQGGTFPRYAPTGPAGAPSGPGKRGTGHIVYWRSGSLFAVPFDAARLEITGSPVPILEGVQGSAGSGWAAYSFSDSGGLVYQLGGSSGGAQRHLAWLDRQGKTTPIPAPPHPYLDARLSPEGQRIAVSLGGGPGEADTWVYDLLRGTLTRLTFQGRNFFPVWTPDGKRVTFVNFAGKQTIAWTLADGSGQPETLVQAEGGPPTSWSPDGKLLAFDGGAVVQNDILLLSVPGTLSGPAGSAAPQPFLKTQHDEDSAAFSPDGRWIAYASMESGQHQVYVRPRAVSGAPSGAPSGPGKWQVSTDGGRFPRWTAGGRELVYRLPDRLMAVAIEPGGAPSGPFRPGTPKELFRYAFTQSFGGNSPGYDASADGKRFVVIQSVAESSAAASEVHFVLEWFEDIRRRVRAGG